MPFTYITWSSNRQFLIGQVVLGSDNNIYKALKDNVNHDPTLNPQLWELLSSIGPANISVSGSANAIEIQGIPIKSTTPIDQQTLTYIQADGMWEATTSTSVLTSLTGSTFTFTWTPTIPAADLTLNQSICTLTLPPPPAGVAARMRLILRQDNIGNRKVIWPINITSVGAIPALSTVAGAFDNFDLYCDDGTTWVLDGTAGGPSNSIDPMALYNPVLVVEARSQPLPTGSPIGSSGGTVTQLVDRTGNHPLVASNNTAATVSGVTNTVNPTITTTAAHSLTVGQTVVISGVLGATGVNGTWVVASVPSTTTFTITLNVAPGVWSSGGSVSGCAAYYLHQPTPGGIFGSTLPPGTLSRPKIDLYPGGTLSVTGLAAMNDFLLFYLLWFHATQHGAANAFQYLALVGGSNEAVYANNNGGGFWHDGNGYSNNANAPGNTAEYNTVPLLGIISIGANSPAGTGATYHRLNGVVQTFTNLGPVPVSGLTGFQIGGPVGGTGFNGQAVGTPTEMDVISCGIINPCPPLADIRRLEQWLAGQGGLSIASS